MFVDNRLVQIYLSMIVIFSTGKHNYWIGGGESANDMYTQQTNPVCACVCVCVCVCERERERERERSAREKERGRERGTV